LGGNRAAALIWIMPFRIRERVVGRAHRYRAATHHPALPEFAGVVADHQVPTATAPENRMGGPALMKV